MTQESDAARLAHGARRRLARERWRAGANAAVPTAADAAIADPLLPGPAARRSGTFALAVAGAVGVHVAVTLLASLGRESVAPRLRAYEQAVQVRVIEPPRPAAAPPTAPLPPAPPPPLAPVVEKPVKVQKVELPPPDPIDLQPPPTPAPPKEPPRRIVGISMESSTTGGGPAFAVGNTRMGETSQVARDPSEVERLAPEMTPPKRTRAPNPEYPAALRAQGIEGDVGLEVEIDAGGRVAKVTITAPSPHDELNRSAKDAAERSTYEPARVNGVAVARAIDFIVRFRLHQ